MTVYLDHAATTPMRPEAVDAMLPWLTTGYGNPSGSHAGSRAARQAVDEARDVVAQCLGCEPGEVIFTGGGTEADNLAIAGVVGAGGGMAACTPVCTAIEHHAVLHSVQALGGRIVAVDEGGFVDLDAMRDALARSPDVAVVSVMLANNEVGTVQPLAELARVVREVAPAAVLHTDAVQAFAWLDVATIGQPADLLSVAAHKFGGPKGVGALVARGSVKLEPLLRGGGQERDRRSGTHNVAGIVAMAAAMRATVEQRTTRAAALRLLRDRLADDVTAAIPGVIETGGVDGRDRRLPNICHLRFDGIESEALLVLLDNAGVCASAGSACASGALEPSHVLAAMGVDPASARSSVRLSLGWPTTATDVEAATTALTSSVAQLRATRQVTA
ncbi:MAG TPA: cysteine desulfurase family protein [Acidimicrobiales bacterium]|nr:cysteine desulfurase family protein [Acidimicrobiales bacterium]